MAKPPHTRAEMRVFYPVSQVTELAAGWRYTTALRSRTSGLRIMCRAYSGLDHGVGYPVLFGLTYSAARRTERRRRYLNGGQYRGKHGAGLLPEKPFRRRRPVRALEQEVMHCRQACSLPGVVETSQCMVTKREVHIASFYIGARALEHLRACCRRVLETVLERAILWETCG